VPANALRWRRIVHYPRSTHYSDVTVPPQWHQWLRHQREHPPSLAEQTADVARQDRLKILAAEADARWAAKPSLMDMPGKGDKGQAVPALDTGKTQPQEQAAEQAQREKGLRDGRQRKTEIKDDPWKKAASGPGEDWQPAPWTPTSSRR
jgi:NADH dehydrogenase [ubiquinone] 1 alpha subcomplex assembly factor 2